MATKSNNQVVVNRDEIVSRLVGFRNEFESSYDSSLIDVHVSFGLMLLDVTEILQLSNREAKQVFGNRLAADIQHYRSTRVEIETNVSQLEFAETMGRA